MKRLTTLLICLMATLSGSYAQKPVASFRVTSRVIHEKPVSPLIYGNFIELGFARQIEGLWAEKLYNASFEEVPPIKESVFGWLGRTPQDDLTGERWWHSGYRVDEWYTWPADTPVRAGINRYWNFHHGLQSQVLINEQVAAQGYLAQDGIWLEKNGTLVFRGYFSNNRTADRNPNPVEVTIGLYPEKNLDKPLMEKKITVPDGIFREFSAELEPGDFSGWATFAVSVGPGQRVAVDGFSLMPVHFVKGWRPEVIRALRQIHVPMVRFPGGCFASFYDWREGVGPRLDRQPVVSEYWGGIEENHAGTVEFIELCREIDAQPFLCVNMLTGTADRTAQWVEYCNGSAETPMGALRKQHGYPVPFGVKYWELDNEAYRRFGWEEYARRCVDFSRAMKAVDPDIRIVMVGYWRYNESLGEMLQVAGRHIDIITDRATAEADLKRDLEIIQEYNRVNGTQITLSNTEWLAPLEWDKSSTDALNYPGTPDWLTLQEHQISWNYAMNTARQLLTFQRLGGDFEFASFNNLANTWGQNIIECAKDTVWISAAGKVFELLSRSRVKWVLGTDTLINLPGVYVQAGLSDRPSGAGGEPPVISVVLLNYRADSPEIRLDLSQAGGAPGLAQVRSCAASGPLAANTYGAYNQVELSESSLTIKNPRNLRIKAGPWSVTEVVVRSL